MFHYLHTELVVHFLHASILAPLQEIVVPLIEVYVLCHFNGASVLQNEAGIGDSVWVLAASRQVNIIVIIPPGAEVAARPQFIKL